MTHVALRRPVVGFLKGGFGLGQAGTVSGAELPWVFTGGVSMFFKAGVFLVPPVLIESLQDSIGLLWRLPGFHVDGRGRRGGRMWPLGRLP